MQPKFKFYKTVCGELIAVDLALSFLPYLVKLSMMFDRISNVTVG